MRSSWLSCKIYKMMEQSGASEGSDWGIQRALEIRWYKDPNTGKKHLCSLNEREHEVIRSYVKRKQEGKETFYRYNNTDDMMAHLDGKNTKKTFIGKDEYGNKIYEVTSNE